MFSRSRLRVSFLVNNWTIILLACEMSFWLLKKNQCLSPKTTLSAFSCVHVYKIPVNVDDGSSKAESGSLQIRSYRLTKNVIQGRLCHISLNPKPTTIRYCLPSVPYTDANRQDLLHFHARMLRPSRYVTHFVLRDPLARWLGIGFARRNDAFNFKAALRIFCSILQSGNKSVRGGASTSTAMVHKYSSSSPQQTWSVPSWNKGRRLVNGAEFS
jgi:hypothetical protein